MLVSTLYIIITEKKYIKKAKYNTLIITYAAELVTLVVT